MQRLIYVLDTYCGWCYGFSPVARQLVADPELELTLMHGALFSGDRSAPISSYGHIGAANARISELTGVSFGAGYQTLLAEGSAVMNSDDAARGLMALRQIAGEDRVLEALGALQEAFFGRGLSLSEPQAYRFAAQKLGLDAETLLAAWASDEVADLARQEQAQVASLGINHYPCLLAVTDQGLVEVGSPTASAQEIKAQLAAL